MALRSLDHAPTEALGNGWELVAPEAGRSNQGLRATVTLFNGTPHACQTLVLGDPIAQQALAATYAGVVGVAASDVTTALMKLTVAVEGTLRQMDADTQAEGHPSQATRLVTLAMGAGAELFHSPEGDAYATIAVEGHRETWSLKVRGFRRWLARLFYEEQRKTPGSQAIQDVLGVLEGKALWDGPACPVYTRLAMSQSPFTLLSPSLSDESIAQHHESWCAGGPQLAACVGDGRGADLCRRRRVRRSRRAWRNSAIAMRLVAMRRRSCSTLPRSGELSAFLRNPSWDVLGGALSLFQPHKASTSLPVRQR